MAEKKKFQAIKGTRDLLPPDTELWNRVEATAREVFGTYGFGEIRLPIFEPTELFARAVGTDTDIVGKEMFSFPDPALLNDPQFVAGWTKLKELAVAFDPALGSIRPDTQQMILADVKKWILAAFTAMKWSIESATANLISLRPEATASVCRAYIENNMQQLPQPVKLCYVGPMFRRERPQKGRFRQFYQIGAEVLEAVRPDSSRDPEKDIAKDAAIDAEVIEMLMTFFERCGLTGATLYINSIGCRDCRADYVKLLRMELQAISDDLGEDSRRRIKTNPLRVLDSKVEGEQPYIERLPRISDHLCEDCAKNYSLVKHELAVRGVRYNENWRLVRGLDYYTRTTFEIIAVGLGSQNAVCGGGRYDGLVELLGGPPTKGIGFAIGEDRLILSLQATAAEPEVPGDEGLSSFSATLQRPDLAVVGTTKDTWERAIQLATALRKRGLSIFLPRSGTKLPRAFDTAHKLGIRVAIVVGEDELRRDAYVIRILKPLEADANRNFDLKTEEIVLYGKIVKLRQDLERALLRLAANRPDISNRQNISFLMERFVQNELLPLHVVGAAREVLPTLNRAIHGQPLAPDSIEWALAAGNLLLNELEKLSPMEV